MSLEYDRMVPSRPPSQSAQVSDTAGAPCSQPDAAAGQRPSRADWLWVAMLLAAAIALAPPAVAVQRVFARAVLYPLLLGAALAAVGWGLGHLARPRSRPFRLLGAALAAVVLVVGQHYVCYRMRLAQQPDIPAQAQFWPEYQQPASLWDYLQKEAHRGRPLVGTLVLRGPLAWLSWGIDALLLLASAVGLLAWWTRSRGGAP
jgi:hypothetical protein